MALNFPSNPSENDIYQFGLLTYVFKNGKWVSQSRGASQLPWYSNMEQARALWKRLAAEAGLNLVDGSFEEGAEITSSSDVVWWQAGSAIYGWHLNEAKTVPVGSTPATAGGIGAGAWVDRTDVTLRSELSEENGDLLVNHTQPGSSTTRPIKTKLDKFASNEDFGSSRNEFGWEPTSDAEILNAPTTEEDMLRNGHVSIAKELYGVRRNASVINAKANYGDLGFNAAVTGVSTTQELANYGYIDNVTAVFDCTSSAYKEWETVSNPVYSLTGFSADGYDFTKLKKGMVVKTLHSTPYFGLILSVSGQTVVISEWRKADSVSSELPPGGTGLVINPVDKLWALNCNIDLPPGSRTKNCAIAEFGLVNNTTPDPYSLNCFDMVILPLSNYGATSGFFVHSSSLVNSKFDACYRARNSRFTGAAFLADEDNHRGFWSVDSTHGFVYSSPDENKYSFIVKKTNEYSDNSLWMGVDAKGRVVRLPDKTRVVSQSGALDLFWRRVINGTHSAITSTLPSSGLQNGDVLVLHCTAPASGLWTISAESILPPGAIKFAASTTLLEGVYDAVYIDGTWYINK